jgi:hypothetical protein
MGEAFGLPSRGGKVSPMPLHLSGGGWKWIEQIGHAKFFSPSFDEQNTLLFSLICGLDNGGHYK